MPANALLGWPFLALVLGVAGLLALLCWPRPPAAPSRWRDPQCLVCLVLPLYMLHQFEEHGINALGQRYHFIEDLCAWLGQPDLSHCPASPAFIFAVNVGGVWLAGLLAILYRRRNVLVGACAVGLPLVNAVAHVGQALVRLSYNSGLLTAVVLFVPFCAWTLRQLFRSGVLDGERLALVVASGVGMHLVLIGSILAHGAGLLPQTPLLVLNVVNGGVPWALASLGRRLP